MVGGIAEVAGGDLQMGLLIATAFPLILILGLIILDRKFKKKKS